MVPEALRYGNRLQASRGRGPVRDRRPGAFTGDGAQPATWTTDLAKVDSQMASHLCSNLKLTCLPGFSLQRFNLPYWCDMRKQVERQPAPGALSLGSDKVPILPRVSWNHFINSRVAVKSRALESRCLDQTLATLLVEGPRRGSFTSPSFSFLICKAVAMLPYRVPERIKSSLR